MRLIAAALLSLPLLTGQEFDSVLAKITGGPTRGAVTVVAFISAECPISNAFNDRMTELYNDYRPQGVRFVFINANANETAAMVAEHRTRAGFPFPVYKDTGNLAADRFGAVATPETYVLDRRGVLRYHGYIEDSINQARVKNRALRSAVEAVLAGNPVPTAGTKAFGCSIKRVRRTT